MKALTLTQPWASMVAIGVKTYETRSWSTPYRGPLAIHAAKGWPEEARRFAMMNGLVQTAVGNGALGYDRPIPLGYVIAVCELVDVQPTGGFAPNETEASLGNWDVGRFAWKLENVRQVPWVLVRGMLGLWECPFEIDP